ncbi:MAG: hypothetical protein JWO73_483 [Candidatus Taylorbacteria bacterium]|nr:hypothetical protein [Candidatus Taylorbacteria bacterium]
MKNIQAERKPQHAGVRRNPSLAGAICSTDCKSPPPSAGKKSGALPHSDRCSSCGKCYTDGKTTSNKPPIQEMRSREEVMAYRFPPLVERLQEELKLSKREANRLFKDMLMFLYICGTNTGKHGYSPSPMIDEAWHTFIIFTREYAKFCNEHFGYFIHHNPFTKENRAVEAAKVTPIAPVARRIFGKLSGNWEGKKANCDRCRGGGACDDCAVCTIR